MKFYAYLRKNPELETRILEARKLGVQTLIDKLLQVFNYQEVESPNEILWIREKAKFVQWVAGKITDINNKEIPEDHEVYQAELSFIQDRISEMEFSGEIVMM